MKRQIIIEGSDAFIPLTKGYVAVIDATDVQLISGLNWHALVSRRTDGAVRSVYGAMTVKDKDGRKRTILLHRALADPPNDMHVDHIDADGLNNRRSNLRIVTRANNNQNARVHRDNASGLKGVCFDRRKSRWRATIMANGKQSHLGYFDTPGKAHAAYCEGSARLHGGFGRTR